MDISISTIISAVRAAVSERDLRRAALGARIRTLVEEVLDACALDALTGPPVDYPGGHGPSWTLSHGHVYATCSQWGDGSEPRTGRESVLLVAAPSLGARRVVGEIPDCSFHDGRNLQSQRGPARLDARDLDDEEYAVPIAGAAPVALLRQIAADLPAVIAAALAGREASVREQASQAADALSSL